MRARRLTDTEIADALKLLPGWRIESGKLHVKWKFTGFPEAIGFMSAIAAEAQAMDHHPEWFNVWAYITVDLITHDLKAISDLDTALARKMQALASRLGAEPQV